MEPQRCKNKKCQKPLPNGYKHKYCEKCRNEHAQHFRDGCKAALGIIVMVGGTAVTILTKGKIKLSKD